MDKSKLLSEMLVGYNLTKSMVTTLRSAPVTASKLLSALKNYSSAVLVVRKNIQEVPKDYYSNWTLGVEETFQMDLLSSTLAREFNDADEDEIIPKEIVKDLLGSAINLNKTVAVVCWALVNEDETLADGITELQRKLISECEKIDKDARLEQRKLNLVLEASEEETEGQASAVRNARIQGMKLEQEGDDDDDDDGLVLGTKTEGIRVISEDPRVKD